MGNVCKQCGRKFERLAQHWSQSNNCQYPPLSQYQREVATGLLMGDGSIDRSSKNACLQSVMISQNYLEHVDKQFGRFGNGVSLHQTAAESAQHNCKSGFSPDADADDYSDVYHWRSMRHPNLTEFAAWYDSGSKVWPDDIELTPTVLKHWYCGDGTYDNNGYNNRIRISMSNEIDNTDKVDAMFENVGLPTPSNYATSERSDGSLRCNAQFTVEKSRKLWDYMGDPLPDFEYKWPEDFK
jgi:hypothetical protein